MAERDPSFLVLRLSLLENGVQLVFDSINSSVCFIEVCIDSFLWLGDFCATSWSSHSFPNDKLFKFLNCFYDSSWEKPIFLYRSQ
jgi:hypothetical protein